MENAPNDPPAGQPATSDTSRRADAALRLALALLGRATDRRLGAGLRVVMYHGEQVGFHVEQLERAAAELAELLAARGTSLEVEVARAELARASEAQRRREGGER